jgi:hypothetical protein
LEGCLPVVLALVGFVLVLPGICSFFFMIASFSRGGPAGEAIGLWMITFLLAALGIALIAGAARNR